MEEIDFIVEEESLSDLLIKEEQESVPVYAFNDDENIENQSNLIVANTVGSNAHIEQGSTAEALEVASYKFTTLSMTPNFEFLDSKNAIGALNYNRSDITVRARPVEINRDDVFTFIEIESAPVVEPFYFFTAIAANVGTSTFGDDNNSAANDLYRVIHYCYLPLVLQARISLSLVIMEPEQAVSLQILISLAYAVWITRLQTF